MRDECGNHFEQRSIGDEPPIAAQQSKVAQQRAAPKLSFRENMKAPTVLFREALRDGELSLNVRLVELVEWFDLY